MPDALPPFPAEVQAVMDGRGDFIDSFAEYVQTRIRANDLSVADCCALLAGLHVVGHATAHAFRHAPDLALRRGRQVDELLGDLAANLARYELLADKVRVLRRELVAKHLDAFHAARATVAEGSGADAGLNVLVDEVFWPLLCRAWLPALYYEDGHGTPAAGEVPPARRSRVWQEPGISRQELRIHARARPDAPLDAVIALLGRDTSTAQAWAAADYLHAADAARRVYRQAGGQPVSAQVLFAATNAAWRLGHALQVLVVPDSAAPASRLTEESLLPAYSAARSFLHDEPLPSLPPGVSWQVAVGDYPGGSDPRAALQGFSAGVVLGAALIARAAGLSLRQHVYATARLAHDGQVRSLGAGDADAGPALRAKGRTAALTAALAGYQGVQVVAAGEDVPELVAGAADLGRSLPVAPAAHLEDTLAYLLENLYAPLVVQQASQIRSRDAEAGAATRGLPQHLVDTAERILAEPATRRWLVVLPTATDAAADHPGATLATALTMATDAGSDHEVVAIRLGARELNAALQPPRGKSRTVADLIDEALPPPAGERVRQARRACIQADLQHGHVAVVVDDLLTDRLNGGAIAPVHLNRGVRLLLDKLVSQVGRVVIAARDGQVGESAHTMLVNELAFRMLGPAAGVES